VEQGAYVEFGRHYAALLKEHGITVELRTTQGAAGNAALLHDAASGVDTSLAHLAGWKLNVGAPGSGVPLLMERLLEANRVEPGSVTLSRQPITPAVVDLLEGRLDAIAIASAPESQMVQMLLRTPGIELANLVQSEAYARRFPFMSHVVLPRGVADLAADIPPQDILLIAPTATLVARKSLHPALMQLFVQAAQQVHGQAGWFQRKGEFPNPVNTERPIAPEAQRFYKDGPPWLQHYLPFWLANLFDRMWIALVAIIAVLLPLSRVVPPLYEFRIRSRVFRWYAQLRAVEDASSERPVDELLGDLEDIEARVGRVHIPLAYADELYALRSHIQLVRRRLQERQKNNQSNECQRANSRAERHGTTHWLSVLRPCGRQRMLRPTARAAAAATCPQAGRGGGGCRGAPPLRRVHGLTSAP
jgi:hypothetical protein